jgi:hypothetical protein
MGGPTAKRGCKMLDFDDDLYDDWFIKYELFLQEAASFCDNGHDEQTGSIED